MDKEFNKAKFKLKNAKHNIGERSEEDTTTSLDEVRRELMKQFAKLR